jgi:MFS family permease
MTSAVFRMTLWNQSIPENLRGRLAGIEMLSYSVGPLGAQIRAGYTADTFGVRRAITAGGVASVVGVVLAAAALQDFWRYDSRTDPHLLAERERRAAHGEVGADEGP